MVTAQPAEAPRGLPQAGGDPPDEHAAVAPAAHVTDEMADEPVEVLDRVRTPECPVQRAGDPETLERERLIQPFAQGGRGAWVRVIEGRRELQEAALGKRGVCEAERLVEHAADPRPHRLREMLKDVPPLVHLAALDDRHRPARVPDRLAEARPAVDDEEHRLVEIEPALADVREERLADGRVLGRTLAQGEDMLAALELHAPREQDDVVPEVEAVDHDDSDGEVLQRAGEPGGQLRARERDEAARHAALRHGPLSSQGGRGSRARRYFRVVTPTAIASKVRASSGSRCAA